MDIVDVCVHELTYAIECAMWIEQDLVIDYRMPVPAYYGFLKYVVLDVAVIGDPTVSAQISIRVLVWSAILRVDHRICHFDPRRQHFAECDDLKA